MMDKLFLYAYTSTHYKEVVTTMLQSGYKLLRYTYLNVHSSLYKNVIVAIEIKMYVPDLSSYMDELAMAEMYNE